MPAIVFAEAAIILWLLMSRARRQWIASLSSDSEEEGVSAHAADPVSSGSGAQRVRAWASTKGIDLLAASWGSSRLDRSLVGAAPADERAIAPNPAPRALRSKHPIAERHRMAVPTRAPQGGAATHRCSRTGDYGTPQRQASHSVMGEPGLREDSFRDLWELLPLGILMLDDQSEILIANVRTQKLFGYEGGQLVGQSISVLVPQLRVNDKSFYRDGFLSTSQALPSGPARSLLARRRDGSEFPVEIGLRQSSFKDDVVILVFIEDKTDHYELLRNQRDLAHLTRVSTMGELAGSLAHELNQPLTAILSNVQAAQRFMATDPIDVAEVREILNDIVQDDYRASEVIRRIRAVVRKGDMEFASVDLATVIRDVALLLRSDAIMRETRVALEICDDLPAVYGDNVQLQQVTLNLLLNALDAMSHVSPRERVVSIALTAEGDDMVRIAVRDCGHGLMAGKLDTVFKSFYTSKPNGLGLGLSISRSIVELHGGRLWAENNTGRGATFFVTLPTENVAGHKQSR
jgi:two-component system sensor kinase FixL